MSSGTPSDDILKAALQAKDAVDRTIKQRELNEAIKGLIEHAVHVADIATELATPIKVDK